MATATVVICAYTLERWEALSAAVSSCLSQTRPPEELVVVIDYNDELLDRASRELTGAVVVPNLSTKGLSGARNTGVAKGSGDVIAFLDDDAFADPTWLDQLLAPLDDEGVAGAGGWIVPEWETSPAAWFPETYYWILGCSYAGLPQSGATLRNPIGASMAIRRRVFDTVGGFTSGIGRIGKVPLGCEETELCIRYTAARPTERFVLTRDAIVHHLVPSSRLTWHYFWTRCWAEGLSKAAVSSLVGSRSGLASERQHLLESLPREIASSALALRTTPRIALTKIALILVGTVIAAAGLARGHVAVWRAPITRGGGAVDLDASNKGECGGSCTCAAPGAN